MHKDDFVHLYICLYDRIPLKCCVVLVIFIYNINTNARNILSYTNRNAVLY